MLEFASKTITLVRNQLINAIKDIILKNQHGLSLSQDEWVSTSYLDESSTNQAIILVEHITSFNGTTVNVCGVCRDVQGTPYQATPDLSLVSTDGLLLIYDAVLKASERERKAEEEIARQYNRQC